MFRDALRCESMAAAQEWLNTMLPMSEDGLRAALALTATVVLDFSPRDARGSRVSLGTFPKAEAQDATRVLKALAADDPSTLLDAVDALSGPRLLHIAGGMFAAAFLAVHTKEGINVRFGAH